MRDAPLARGAGGGLSEAAPVILASASRIRLDLLLRAGVPVRAEPARIDEAEVKSSLGAEGASAREAAESLAELKAQRTGRRHSGVLVIGADQLLDCDGRWFDKPENRDRAAADLRALGGKRHALITSVCVVRDGARLWHHTEAAYLTMRPLSDAFIAEYLDAVGDVALGSVGAYQIEALGAQLFSHVEGDYFSILGLPLLPLLEFLRNHEIVPR